MTSLRKVEANRRNAARSTGPRSVQGKLRASRNALKHGLSTPATNEPEYADELERLTQQLTAGESDLERLALARSAAEAELLLKRVRLTRSVLLKWAIGKLNRDTAMALKPVRNKAASVVKGLGAISRLERYERRAFSRRKRLFRDLASCLDGARNRIA